MWCIGQRKTARLFILEQDVDVLSGQELQAFVGRQLEREHHHIRRGPFHLLHAAWHGLDRDVIDRSHLTALKYQIRQRLGATEQRHARDLFRFAQCAFLIFAVIYLTRHHLALACPAYTVAAAVWQRVAVFQGGLEDGFVFLDGKAVATGLNNRIERHDRILSVALKREF